MHSNNPEFFKIKISHDVSRKALCGTKTWCDAAYLLSQMFTNLKRIDSVFRTKFLNSLHNTYFDILFALIVCVFFFFK